MTMLLALCFFLWLSGPECSAFWPVWTRGTIAVAWTMLVLLVILHLALFLLFVRPMMLGIMAGMLWKDSCLRRSGSTCCFFSGRRLQEWLLEEFHTSLVFMVVSVFCAMLGSTLDTCSLVRCTRSRAGSTAGCACPQLQLRSPPFVVHSPFGWLYHRRHCNCRDPVLFVGRLPCLCGPFVLRECLRRDVVWWWIFHSWWCLRFCLGQCEADGWKIPHQFFPVPRGCWVCMHAELLVQQHLRNLPRHLQLLWS